MPSKGWLEQLADSNYFLRVLGRKFDIEHVNISEALEKDRFAFHYRLSSGGADVAQAEHRCIVRHDCY